MKLTAENVKETLLKCLFKDGEDTTSHIISEGVRLKIGFKPEKLEEQRVNIEDMLNQLPDGFKQSIGGGQSFLNACITTDGDQWGEHSNIDELICLGLAIGKLKFLMPRDMWQMFPGGMPYLVIEDNIKV